MSFTDIDATNAMFEAHFAGDDPRPIVTEMRDGFAVTHMNTDGRHMRPGDMINGLTKAGMDNHQGPHVGKYEAMLRDLTVS